MEYHKTWSRESPSNRATKRPYINRTGMNSFLNKYEDSFDTANWQVYAKGISAES